MSVNPLLEFSGLPRYKSVRPEHVAPAIDQLLVENRALIARLTTKAMVATWNEFADPLENANERLWRAWGMVAHLHAVDDNPAIRDAYNANLPKITRYRTELAQNLRLYEKFKALRASKGFEELSQAQRKIVENDLRDYRLGGAELAPQNKRRFAEIQEELAALEAKFSENLLDATNAFSELIADRGALLGVPEDVLEAAEEGARKDGREGWKFTLHAPSYGPLMQYAENRDLREKLYRAHVTRASEFGNPQFDNTSIIVRELRLRKEKARLLGYKSFAEFSLVPKMAESPEAALDFLNDLAARALPHARRDHAELEEFARTELGIQELQAWDIAFASEKLRAKRYAFSDQEVKRYFPEPKVLEGMFQLVKALYGIRILPDAAETWHPEVRFFRITDSDGSVIGQFYLDLYSRETKRGGAWMDEAITRQRMPGGLRTPVAHLICNFPAPMGNKPALFTHDEVMTLFHEFGHGLHHLLSRVDDLGVSGIRGVEWDAVELPSQFMENFCWEWGVLARMTAHVESGEALPRNLFDKMLAARNFQSGMQTVRQIEFALSDMHLHHDYDPAGAKTPLQLLNEIRAKVAVAMPPEYNRFLNNFSHVFSGAYAAGYYSYKWAEVLSADAYSLFEENGVLDSDTGARFRDEILAVGGSRPALESFRAFRGREPRIDALLRHNGMIAP
ncbi:MAG: M3 family metallopeptidase [Betaproteobacteria bacterium]|nr:MAG: M3 family metallopeptidase [Betaproteobacteria bacterium]